MYGHLSVISAKNIKDYNILTDYYNSLWWPPSAQCSICQIDSALANKLAHDIED